MCVIYRKKKTHLYSAKICLRVEVEKLVYWKRIIQTAVEETSEINHYNVPYTKQVA